MYHVKQHIFCMYMYHETLLMFYMVQCKTSTIPSEDIVEFVHVHVHVVGSNPTQGSFFFKKRKSCPGCISLPCFVYHVNHSV